MGLGLEVSGWRAEEGGIEVCPHTLNTHRQDWKDEGRGGAAVILKNKQTPQGYTHTHTPPPPSPTTPPPPPDPHLLLLFGWQQLQEIAATLSLDHQHQHHSYSSNTRSHALSLSFCLSTAAGRVEPICFEMPEESCIPGTGCVLEAGWEGRRHTGEVVAVAAATENTVLNLA